MRDKHQSVASCTLPNRDKPAVQAGALTGNRTGSISFHGIMHNLLSHTSQGNKYLFLNGDRPHKRFCPCAYVAGYAISSSICNVDPTETGLVVLLVSVHSDC